MLISGDASFFANVPGDLAEQLRDRRVVDFREWEASGMEGAIGVGCECDPATAVRSFRAGNLHHFIQRESPNCNQELSLADAFIKDPATYFQAPARGLLRNTVASRTWDFGPTTSKAKLFEELLAVTDAFESRGLSGCVSATCEEVYMNALLDAPNAAIRLGSETAPYASREHAKIHFAHDGERLVIACEDPYGELSPAAFVRRMDEVYTQGVRGAMRMEAGQGAGIGCVLMFESCESLFLGVQPGKKTLVSCVIHLRASQKKRAGFRKNLHLIYSR